MEISYATLVGMSIGLFVSGLILIYVIYILIKENKKLKSPLSKRLFGITNERYSGNSTLIIDYAIQTLFREGEIIVTKPNTRTYGLSPRTQKIFILPDGPETTANSILMYDRIKKRLLSEHGGDKFNFDPNHLKITLKLK